MAADLEGEECDGREHEHDPALATGWVKSVTYVPALSLWALVAGHWSAWQAARAEFEEEADIPGDVVKRVVEETEIELAESPPKPRRSRNARPAR
jgi:hypothetical protein